MPMLLTAAGYAQFLTVLVIFVVVLAITAWVTKWMANYQKQQNVGSNIEIMETIRITSNKYIQLVRVGETYKVIAVCKDTVTMLGEVPAEQLKFSAPAQGMPSFKEWFDKAVKKDSGDQDEPKDIDE